MSIRKHRISEESSTMDTNEEIYGFVDHYATEQIYSTDYQLLSIRRQPRAMRHKVPTISLDMHYVNKDHMKTFLLDLKREKKIIKIHRRVRKKYSYMNYPFYKHDLILHSSSLQNIQFL